MPGSSIHSEHVQRELFWHSLLLHFLHFVFESSHWGWYRPLVKKACIRYFYSLHGNQHILGPQEALLELTRLAQEGRANIWRASSSSPQIPIDLPLRARPRSCPRGGAFHSQASAEVPPEQGPNLDTEGNRAGQSFPLKNWVS